MNKWVKFLHRDSRTQEDVHNGPLVRLEDLVKAYDTKTVKVLGLEEINPTIGKGEFVAIMGRSGSRKSTLMNILGCLDRPTLDHCYLGGIDVADMRPDQLSDVRNRRIGFVFQSFNLIFKTSTFKDVGLSMAYARVPEAKRTVRAQLLLEQIGLEARKEHMPNKLSSGQGQKVTVAKALTNESPLILTDGPTGNLGTASSVEIMELFIKLHQEGATVVLVTHEEDMTAFTYRVTRFNDGRIQSDKLNMARMVLGNRKGGEQGAD